MQIVDAEVPKSFRLDRVGVADPTTWNAKATCRGMQRLLQTLEELAGRTDRTVQQQAASLLKEGIRIPSTTRQDFSVQSAMDAVTISQAWTASRQRRP